MMDPYRGIVDPDPSGRDAHSHRHESWWSYLWWLLGLVLLLACSALLLRLLF